MAHTPIHMNTLVFFRFYHSGKIAGGTLHSASRPARSAMAWYGVVSAVSTTSARPGPFRDLAAAVVSVALLFVDGAVRIEADSDADSDAVGLGDPEGLRVNPCVRHAQLLGMPLAPFRRARAGGDLGSVRVADDAQLEGFARADARGVGGDGGGACVHCSR
jgi:hypothetical protein